MGLFYSVEIVTFKKKTTMELKDKAEIIKGLTEEELDELATVHGITVQKSTDPLPPDPTHPPQP